MKKRRMFTKAALVVALVFWFFDSFTHYFLYDEPVFEIIPQDSHELWMRILIVFLLITFGACVDIFFRKLLCKETQIEGLLIYKSMIYATNHILNNLLNQLQLLRMEASECEGFDEEVIRQYDGAIIEAKNLINKLSHVEHISSDNIKESVYPRQVTRSSTHSASDNQSIYGECRDVI